MHVVTWRSSDSLPFEWSCEAVPASASWFLLSLQAPKDRSRQALPPSRKGILLLRQVVQLSFYMGQNLVSRWVFRAEDGEENFWTYREREEATRDGKLRNDRIHDLQFSPFIITVIISRRFSWAGHVAYVGWIRSACKVLVWKFKGWDHLKHKDVRGRMM